MDEHKGRLRASELEDSGDLGVNPTHNLTMGEIIASRFSRRDLLRGSLAVAAISATVGTRALAANGQPARMAAGASFDFKEIEAGIDQTHHVAEGYDAKVLLRWGDPLFPDAPEFDPASQTPEKQARQFGYNTDFVGYVPIDGSSDHGLLVANHEYTNEELMFPGFTSLDALTVEQVKVAIAAHGLSVVEIERVGRTGEWKPARSKRLRGGTWHAGTGRRYVPSEVSCDERRLSPPRRLPRCQPAP